MARGLELAAAIDHVVPDHDGHKRQLEWATESGNLKWAKAVNGPKRQMGQIGPGKKPNSLSNRSETAKTTYCHGEATNLKRPGTRRHEKI